MLVFCEECGSSNDVDPKALENLQNPVRCSECGDILNKTKAAFTAASKPVARTPAAPATPAKNQAIEYINFKDVVLRILAQYPN